MTVGQFASCLAGYKNRLKNDLETADNLHHMLGIYIATGVNNPKKYPSNPFTHKEATSQQMSPDQYEQLARMKYGKK